MTKSSKKHTQGNTLGNQKSVSDPAENKPMLWGKQTELSLNYFAIGKHTFEQCFIDALVSIKRASAQVNHELHLINDEQLKAIIFACNELLDSKHADQFPLKVWQTGSGTQTNMNVNEVITSLANTYLLQGGQGDPAKDNTRLHPNDHINMSQSSNDVFPTAMHIVVAQQTLHVLLPSIERMERALSQRQSEFDEFLTVARTHLMDALPIKAGALLSAHEQQITAAKKAIEESLISVHQLALGGTAVGSGANAPNSFGQQVIALLAEQYQLPFVQHENLYAAVSGEDALMRFSCSLKQLATALFKLANDFRLLGSGPRCGLNEWHLPANEPGSSIMPGKVNPTQCEALSMVCLQVFGNDLTVSLAASNGQLQLNTYRPVIIHNVLESIALLADAINSFSKNTIQGLQLNHMQTDNNMRSNLSIITLLAPKLGYDVATKIVQQAVEKNESLATAAESLGLFSQVEFERLIDGQLNI
ncbi:class II fumarate hydratase [Thalassotalea sp. Y01]|uniref:class II fumarate hydratase n=1 Tax=Thalassotalea sp. Y01 TaxID=2729613 RepID=UPI00145E032D|nr:class II fumarate hydratase [Thalassotalea sp. Y01]NMP17355.1 class II fumarate hydratase [Thalassotalea sp. Y01]